MASLARDVGSSNTFDSTRKDLRTYLNIHVLTTLLVALQVKLSGACHITSGLATVRLDQ